MGTVKYLSTRAQPRSARLSADLDQRLRLAIARELRRRRLALGLTQAALGEPLTRSYVCAVERGRAVPSLPALRLMASRLGVGLADFFAAVEASLSSDT